MGGRRRGVGEKSSSGLRKIRGWAADWNCAGRQIKWVQQIARGYAGRPKAAALNQRTPASVQLFKRSYSSDSGSMAMFFSPAAFFSLYFFTHASKLLPAAVSRPVKAIAAISA